MKHQDYNQIKNAIRQDHIDNAASWEAEAQQSRRSIRGLSIGVCSIAAVLAICVSIISERNSYIFQTAATVADTEIADTELTEPETTDVTELTAAETDLSEQVTTETTPVSAALNADGRNVLGGLGNLHAYDINALSYSAFHFAEDDEFYYELNNGLRASKADENPAFAPYSIDALPQIDLTNTRLFPVDNMCFMQQGNALYRMETGENTVELTQLAAFTESSWGEAIENVEIMQVNGFARDENGNSTRLFILGSADVTGEEYGVTFRVILDLQTGEFSHFEGIGLCATVFIADDAVYSFTEDYGPELHWDENDNLSLDQYSITLSKYTGVNECETVDVNGWGINTCNAFVDGSGMFWFQNNSGQFCTASFGDSAPTVLADEFPFVGGDYLRLNGIDQVVVNNEYPSDILISNFDSSDMETVLVSNDESAYLNGAFTENGVIHISAEKYGKVILVTKDGDEVTSCTVTVPEENIPDYWDYAQ